ncbi:MAG TPA: alpha-L-fucosidase [Chitinophagaceae bacterium]|nr:alpha-L-fucosidase [Chitinophagaceae bacterium]
MKKTIWLVALCCWMQLNAQQHNYSKDYVWPSDTAVRRKLDAWQDIKFGLLMHWGTYSQWGIVESWSICPEDEGWTQRRGPYAENYFEYVKAYENLQTTFNPVDFNPDKWAKAAREAGMRYVVFTTKHHDGFCMFDTHQTDYKITGSKTPFSSNPRANVTREVFDAFRKQGFLVGAYYSKPDWHCPFYWWPYFPPKDRNVNYDPKKYPERWAQFKEYTFQQIKELMTGYGKVDILWLDGGWVRPRNTIDDKVDWQRSITYDQDIDMPRIARMAREHQPGLLVVDRTVKGEYENYATPEQTIPAEALDYPWESCITMGNSWSYVPNDHYKSTNDLVHMLLKIISRGGNLLLNIGPSPQGDWSDTAYSRLKEIGAWMRVHQEAVYNTVPLAPYEKGNLIFLQSKDKRTQYLYVLSQGPGSEQVTLPKQLIVEGLPVHKPARIFLLDYPGKQVPWRMNGDSLVIEVPKSLCGKPVGKYAIAFKIVH